MRRTFALALALAGCSGGKPNDVADDAKAGDAALRDGPTGDAGRDLSTNRGLFFGDSRCAAANAALCEDFEAGTLPSYWQTVGTAPVIDTLQAARGTHALHIHLHANGPSYIKESVTFPALASGYYARAFIYFTHLPTTGMTYAHWTAFASSTSLGEIRLSGQYQNGKNLWGVGTDSGSNAAGTGDWTTNDNDPSGAPRTIPTGEWMCLEWQHDSADDTTRVWWDGVEHASLATTATMHGGNSNPFAIPDITAAWFGWQEYQTSTQEFELWIDELAIDGQRIGCVI